MPKKTDPQPLSTADLTEPAWSDTPPGDPFDGHAPLDGLEHLGRHIVDASGVPSGSPANFEQLRGSTGRADPSVVANALDALRAEFGGSTPAGDHL